MANILLFLLPAILGILIPQPAVAKGGNYILSGETLNMNDRLTFENFNLVMQDDCNLVLYNGDWQSNTANRGSDCKATVNNNGQLVIQNGDGNTVFITRPKSKNGNYALVLHPEGVLAIYGPAVFEINPSPPNGHGLWLGNTPTVRNALFSGQVLYGDGQLTDKNYRLVMQGDCNLVLYGGTRGWQSNTHGNGQHCFLRLDHSGELAIKDDDYNTIWSSRSRSTSGDYVLILQDNGKAVVYGPINWATRQLDTRREEIAMVTGKK